MTMRSAVSAIRLAAVAIALALAAQSLAVSPAAARITVRKVESAIAPAAAGTPPQGQLQLALNLPLAKLQAVANLFAFQIDKSGTISGQSYEGTISLSNITLQPSDDADHPLTVGAHFKFAGHISGKNVVGGGTTTLNLAVKVGPNWCPIVDMTSPATQWDTDIDVPFAVRVAIGLGIVDHIIAGEFSKLTACPALKAQLQALWQPAVIHLFGSPAGKSAAATAVVLNLKPQAIDVTSVTIKDGRLVAKLALLGSASVAAKPAAPATLVLPNPSTWPHTPGEADKSEFSLAVFGNVGVGP